MAAAAATRRALSSRCCCSTSTSCIDQIFVAHRPPAPCPSFSAPEDYQKRRFSASNASRVELLANKNCVNGGRNVHWNYFRRESSSSFGGNGVLHGSSSFFPGFRDDDEDLNLCSGKFSLRSSQRRLPPVCSVRGSAGRVYQRRSFSVDDVRSFSGGAEIKNKFPTASGSRGLSVTAFAASAAAPAPSPSRGPSNWWSELWSNFFALCASFASRLESVRIGWLDLLTMLRIVLLAAGAFGAYIASKKAWEKIQGHAAGKSGGEEGEAEGEGGGQGGPMQVLARGATCVQSNMGPWSLSDMVLGLTAIAKVTEKQPPSLPGQEVKDLSKDGTFLLRAQHWRAISEAVYAPDSGSFSLFSNLPESSLVSAKWAPDQESFRPAYAVCVDASHGAVVLAVRGTSHIIDMLLNSGTSPEPFGEDGGYAHGGFVHATNMLYDEVLPVIEKAFKDHGGNQKELKLVITGHSLGAAVGTLTALRLREKFPDLEVWAFCPPACMSLEMAKECKSFTTSFVSFYDLVPRFSFQTVERLRTKIQEFDWDVVEKVAKDDEDWQNIKKAMDTFRGLQQVKEDAVKKLEDMGMSDNESLQKAKDKGSEALEGQTGKQVQGLAKDVGNKVTGFFRGSDAKQSDEKGEDGKGEDGNEEESEEDKEPPPPLYPPGRLLVLGSSPPGCGKMPEQRSDVNSQRNYGSYPTFDEAKNITWRMVEVEQEDLDEIIVSPWLVADHMLGNMCEGISYFQSRCPPVIK